MADRLITANFDRDEEEPGGMARPSRNGRLCGPDLMKHMSASVDDGHHRPGHVITWC